MSGQFRDGQFFVDNKDVKEGSLITVEYNSFVAEGVVVLGHDSDLYVKWKDSTFTHIRDVFLNMKILLFK